MHTNIEMRALSGINYLFLRAVTEKEVYSESVVSELNFVFSKLAEEINNDSYRIYNTLKGYIFEELNEGDYLTTDISEFREKLFSFCTQNFDMDDSEIEIITNYYLSIAVEVIEKQNSNDEIEKI